jgi:hypothetical protein
MASDSLLIFGDRLQREFPFAGEELRRNDNSPSLIIIDHVFRIVLVIAVYIFAESWHNLRNIDELLLMEMYDEFHRPIRP